MASVGVEATLVIFNVAVVFFEVVFLLVFFRLFEGFLGGLRGFGL